MSTHPLVSVVTPSLNQGRFIRSAIESVLAQPYPRIEYLVVDGGSDDDTLEILRSFGDGLRWISEPDNGQSEAINKGFRLTGGDILAWLNADDVFAGDAIGKIVKVFRQRPEVGLVYGQGLILDERGDTVGPFTEIEPYSLWRLLNCLDFILQPAAFFRRSAFESVGGLDESLRFAMDWDLWIRLSSCVDAHYVTQVLACSREYGETKTSTGGFGRIHELGTLARKHTGRFWTPGVRLYFLDTIHRLVKQRLPHRFRHLADGPFRAAMGRLSRNLPSYADGWLGPKGKVVVPRRWGSVSLELEIPDTQLGSRPAVRLEVSGGKTVAIAIEEPGILEQEVSLPDGVDPFVELEIFSNFKVQSPQDPRRLAVRLLNLDRGTTPVDTTVRI